MQTVTIVYPTDPLGVVPGGTDTCIRDILRCAPEDTDMRLIGVTTDPASRPPGRWTECELGDAKFQMYPLMAVPGLEKQQFIPLSLKFTLKLLGKAALFSRCDVIQFHRIEPALALTGVDKPKVLIIHQNMGVLKDRQSDIRWKYLPGFYFALENYVIKKLQNVFIVREDAVASYRERFPGQADRIEFLPTWMNPSLFYQESVQAGSGAKSGAGSHNPYRLIFVGRLDHQKNPLLLINSLAALNRIRSDWKMTLVGDGVLRGEVEKSIRDNNLQDMVELLGALPQTEVANLLRKSDVMLLTSAYEGMPRCVVESLGCGVPVVTSRVGEVALVVNHKRNGLIVDDESPESFASSINELLDSIDNYSGEPCLSATQSFRADVVLERLYTTYRSLVAS